LVNGKASLSHGKARRERNGEWEGKDTAETKETMNRKARKARKKKKAFGLVSICAAFGRSDGGCGSRVKMDGRGEGEKERDLPQAPKLLFGQFLSLRLISSSRPK
jgi:hypothetical protein